MATMTLMMTMIKEEQHYDGWEVTFGGFIILHERTGSNKPGGGGGHYLRNRRDWGRQYFFEKLKYWMFVSILVHVTEIIII